MHFNSLAPCGANLYEVKQFVRGMRISTHSPRVGRTCHKYNSFVRLLLFQLTRPVWGEPNTCRLQKREKNISTHSPRVGRTVVEHDKHYVIFVFQLTRPVWGEPQRGILGTRYVLHFNSLAPCGANLRQDITYKLLTDFNSLAPCGANHPQSHKCAPTRRISTHSPRVGRTFHSVTYPALS